MTPAERFNEVLKVTGTNVKSLSELLGYSRPQGLYDVAAGRTKSLSADLCRKIVTAFPEFNYTWLVTGEGYMLQQSQKAKEEFVKDGYILPGDVMRLFLNMSDTIKRQEDNISKMTDMVIRLTGGGIPKKEIAG